MEGMDPLRIGETIKIKRIHKRITQTNLAKKLKISQTHLSNAENGRVMLSLKALLKLRDIFECTLDELVDPDRFEKKKERVIKIQTRTLQRVALGRCLRCISKAGRNRYTKITGQD